jgi:hypothetical protein
MNQEKINNARFECERFLKRIDELDKSSKCNYKSYLSKETAAVKRSSMDLTRSLAELRKAD